MRHYELSSIAEPWYLPRIEPRDEAVKRVISKGVMGVAVQAGSEQGIWEQLGPIRYTTNSCIT